MPRLRDLALVVSVLATGCKGKGDVAVDRGAPPPPVASGQPGACSSGGGTVSDHESAPMLPRASGGYCLDPNGETRSFGQNAHGTLDAVCTELFDGDCELYKRFGLVRVVTVRYVDGRGSSGQVSVNLSRFASRDGAYGFFTRRAIGDADPITATVTALGAGGAGALGSTNAVVWRGEYVAELYYSNDVESPDQLTASGHTLLPGLSRALGDLLPGDKAEPAAVRLLPGEQRVALGVRYLAGDALDVSGAGPGALGFYQDGERRWRVLMLVRGDESAAKDVLKTFHKLPGAKELKGQSFDVISVTLKSGEDAPKVSWLFARKGALVVAVGDEELVLGPDVSAEDSAKRSLGAEQKLALLKKLGEGSPAPATSASAAAPSAAPR